MYACACLYWYFHVDDLKNGFGTFLESFANFLDSDDCPSHVKDMLEETKCKFDNQITWL